MNRIKWPFCFKHYVREKEANQQFVTDISEHSSFFLFISFAVEKFKKLLVSFTFKFN